METVVKLVPGDRVMVVVDYEPPEDVATALEERFPGVEFTVIRATQALVQHVTETERVEVLES